MDQTQSSISQKIAQAATAFEARRTRHGRKWVAVFLNEDTIVIALHGCLTAAEKALSQSPAGAARVRAFHQQLFANASVILFRKIERITGMEVRDTSAEIEPTSGSVVHVLTTDTLAVEFLTGPGGAVRTRAPGHHSLSRHDGRSFREAAWNARACPPRGTALRSRERDIGIRPSVVGMRSPGEMTRRRPPRVGERNGPDARILQPPVVRFAFFIEEIVMTETCGNTHDSKVVSVSGDKLTTTCSQGKEHCYTVAKDAKVTCDGKASKAADLKPGTFVRVTEKKDDKNVATAIDSGKHIPAMAAKA
jgi:uncharacterized protein YbcI